MAAADDAALKSSGYSDIHPILLSSNRKLTSLCHKIVFIETVKKIAYFKEVGHIRRT